MTWSSFFSLVGATSALGFMLILPSSFTLIMSVLSSLLLLLEVKSPLLLPTTFLTSPSSFTIAFLELFRMPSVTSFVSTVFSLGTEGMSTDGTLEEGRGRGEEGERKGG